MRLVEAAKAAPLAKFYNLSADGMEDILPYFHTNSILDFVHVFTEKYIRMSGSYK